MAIKHDPENDRICPLEMTHCYILTYFITLKIHKCLLRKDRYGAVEHLHRDSSV